MSLVDQEDVLLARSPISHRTTDRPAPRRVARDAAAVDAAADDDEVDDPPQGCFLPE